MLPLKNASQSLLDELPFIIYNTKLFPRALYFCRIVTGEEQGYCLSLIPFYVWEGQFNNRRRLFESSLIRSDEGAVGGEKIWCDNMIVPTES